jgi:hypothetical protein
MLLTDYNYALLVETSRTVALYVDLGPERIWSLLRRVAYGSQRTLAPVHLNPHRR